jgi:hypothetical protein
MGFEFKFDDLRVIFMAKDSQVPYFTLHKTL